MSATKRGAVAESITCTALLRRGRDVLFPAWGLSPPYDLVTRGGNGEFYKVQIKRAHYRVRGNSRNLRVNITNSRGSTYPAYEVDVMSIVDVETNRVWFIPITVLKGQKTVSLSSGKYDEYLL